MNNRHGPTSVGEVSDWTEFTRFQVHRRRKVAGRSVSEQTSQTLCVRPHVTLNAVTNASTESEHIDVDYILREKFHQRNVHGHSSDSSVAILLYGKSAAETEPAADVEIDAVIETGPVLCSSF